MTLALLGAELVAVALRDAGFPGGSVVKNPPADAGDAGDADSIPGLGRAQEEEKASHSSILAWEIPGTEEPGGLQSMGSQKSQTRLSDSTATAKGTR